MDKDVCMRSVNVWGYVLYDHRRRQTPRYKAQVNPYVH